MQNTKIIVGLGSCGIAAGAGKTYQKIETLIAEGNLDIKLGKTSCVGMCYREPLVEIHDATGVYLYGDVDESRVSEIIEKHIREHTPVKEYLVKTDLFPTPDDTFLKDQVKITLRNCGMIDPEQIEEYEARGGYEAVKKITAEKLTSADIIKTVLESGIRGRGGGGFPTGMKWKFAAGYPSPEKYIICNADEGDPGAFMDRSVLEGDPHTVLEGMIIGGYAIGASDGIIYCRAEYPLAIKRLNIALGQARAKGY
ncbi:MAG: NADH-quinone oxidoreductase subunit F, partial [Bacteroidetes bacterium HGW-Bacteroidetes-22]